jgi:hypothetical protein
MIAVMAPNAITIMLSTSFSTRRRTMTRKAGPKTEIKPIHFA